MSIEEEITKRGNFLNGKNFKTIKSKSLFMNARNLLNENNLKKFSAFYWNGYFKTGLAKRIQQRVPKVKFFWSHLGQFN